MPSAGQHNCILFIIIKIIYTDPFKSKLVDRLLLVCWGNFEWCPHLASKNVMKIFCFIHESRQIIDFHLPHAPSTWFIRSCFPAITQPHYCMTHRTEAKRSWIFDLRPWLCLTPTLALKSPAINTTSAKCTIRSHWDKFRYNSSLVSEELQSMGAYTKHKETSAFQLTAVKRYGIAQGRCI